METKRKWEKFQKDLVDKLFDWFKPEERLNPDTRHILAGFFKAFFTYFGPMTLLQRKLKIKNFRRAIALGVFVSGVRTMDVLLTAVKQHPVSPNEEVTEPTQGERRAEDRDERESFERRRNQSLIVYAKKYSFGVAAFICSVIALLIDGDLPNSTLLTIWVLSRAFRANIPRIPFGPIMVMCLSTAHILPTFVFQPQELSPTYMKFLLTHGGKDQTVLQNLRELTPRNGCPIIHPGESCRRHFFRFWVECYQRATKLYFPFYVVTLLLSSNFNLRSLYHFAVNMLRSAGGDGVVLLLVIMWCWWRPLVVVLLVVFVRIFGGFGGLEVWRFGGLRG
eukprot:TRINITY_DN8940_c0_g1_i1.p1 TRINITY_DN8940_c0_g1~~TRINITY_DN8940_c0_g1_i1.p1  ORF type:complete len:335 (+),score=40.61 TRINITY_DN8940_c0_g1_i1:249-1253(+)